MRNKITTFSFLCFFILLFVQCKIIAQSSEKPGTQNKNTNKGLKDYYKKYFPIGVAVGSYNLKGDEAGLILQEFNSLTPENAMKMGPIHPEENRYFWRDADSIVNFAQQNRLKVRSHNLCWHSQTPRCCLKILQVTT